jgi:hypothetical protein
MSSKSKKKGQKKKKKAPVVIEAPTVVRIVTSEEEEEEVEVAPSPVVEEKKQVPGVAVFVEWCEARQGELAGLAEGAESIWEVKQRLEQVLRVKEAVLTEGKRLFGEAVEAGGEGSWQAHAAEVSEAVRLCYEVCIGIVVIYSFIYYYYSLLNLLIIIIIIRG